MINELNKAIFQRYKGTVYSKDSPLYYREAPQDAAGSWVVYTFVGKTNDEWAGGKNDNVKQIDIQFGIYNDTDDGGLAVGVLTDAVSEVFDWCTLNIEGYQCVSVKPNAVGGVELVDGFWQCIILYEIDLVKE